MQGLQSRQHAPALKMLHWKKVPAMRLSNSIWVPVRGKASIARFALDKREMEALLCEDPRAPKGKKKKRDHKTQRKDKTVSLLEAKRQQNIGIALAQFKCSEDAIRLAVLTMVTPLLPPPPPARTHALCRSSMRARSLAPCAHARVRVCTCICTHTQDMAVLNVDRLLALQTMLPTADEEKTLHAYLKQHKGDVTQLGPIERHVIMLTSLPHLREWLGAMLFREDFRVRHGEIRDKLTLARECAEAVRSSDALQEVFALVLTVGNFINEGHMLGNAVAFTFASTALLVGNRLCNKRGTLLHYMVQALARRGSQALAALDALNDRVKKVLAFSLDFLVVEVTEVSTACASTQATIASLGKDKETISEEHRGYVSDFIAAMGAFLQQAVDDVKKLGDLQV